MSVYGFFANNNSGYHLINDQWYNLHYVGKATVNNSASETVYMNDGSTIIYKQLVYAITIWGGGTPVPFIKPNSTTQNFGLIGVENQGNFVWHIKVLVDVHSASSTITDPTVYVFSNVIGAPTTENYGLQVFNSSGYKTFDSGKSPLIVTHAITTNQPEDPLFNMTENYNLGTSEHTSEVTTTEGLFGKVFGNTADNPQWNAAQRKSYTWGNSWFQNVFNGLSAKSINTYNFTPSGPPMFLFSSVATAVVNKSVYARQRVCVTRLFGSCLVRETKTWNHNYWTFYRGTIRYDNTNLFSTWSSVQQDWNYQSQESESRPIGPGMGYGLNNGGQPPHSTKSINLRDNVVLIANSALYD